MNPGSEAETVEPASVVQTKPVSSNGVPSPRTRYALLAVIVLMLASLTAVALDWIREIENEFNLIHANLLALPPSFDQDQTQILRSDFVPSEPQS